MRTATLLLAGPTSNCTMSYWFPGKPRYDGTGDLSGKVVLVTGQLNHHGKSPGFNGAKIGGSSGIGYILCKLLLQSNAKVWLAARNPTKAEKAIEELKKETGKEK